MKIFFMKFIDKWVGSFICFFLSIINIFISFFSKNTSSNNSCLFIELSEMGSIILAYPAFDFISSRMKKEDMYFLTFKRNKPIASLLGIFNEENIFSISDKSLFQLVFDTFKTIKLLRVKKLSIIYDFELFSRFTVILSYIIHSPKRIGFHAYEMSGLYRGNLLTHKVMYNPHFHMKDNYLSISYAAFYDNSDLPLLKKERENVQFELPKWKMKELTCTSIFKVLKDKKKDIFEENSKIIVIKPGGGLLPIRAWPMSNYIELIRKLLIFENYYIILVGTEEDKNLNSLINYEINHERLLDITCQTSLNDIMDLFCYSNLLIANDSGPAHFSVLTDIPSLIFYGPETPKLYGPISQNSYALYSNFCCSPCLNAYNLRTSKCKNNMCLKNISVDYVYELSKNILVR